VSVAVLGLPAVALAQANENDQSLDTSIAADFPPSDAEPLEMARVRVGAAAERVDERHQQITERQTAADAAASRAAPSPQLAAIAECESGGDYSANTGNGFHGAYQFTEETWASVGGSGLPSEAPPAEQDMRAQMLLEQSGTSPWPVCGQ
jgi:hypothetical protein